MVNIEELSAEDQCLLKNRCEIDTFEATSTICLHHKKIYLDLYSSLQKKCCNPFDLHTTTTSVKGGLRTLSIDEANRVNRVQRTSSVHAGMKVCPKCRIKLFSVQDVQSSTSSDTETMETTQDDFVPEEVAEDQLNESLTSLGVSPCKVSKLKKTDRAPYVKRKLKQMQEKSKTLVSACADIPATTLGSIKNSWRVRSERVLGTAFQRAQKGPWDITRSAAGERQTPKRTNCTKCTGILQ